MSLVPLLFRDWWDDEDFSRSSRLLDQHFGIGLHRDDLLNNFCSFPRSSLLKNYIRPWVRSYNNQSVQRQDSGSTIQQDKDKYQVILDVQQFAPNEITVKTSENSIIVEGKHEEKKDEHGFISRHFTRRYLLSQDYDINGVISSLSSDGVLTINAPKKSQMKNQGERVVNIVQTGGPAKPISTTENTQSVKIE